MRIEVSMGKSITAYLLAFLLAAGWFPAAPVLAQGEIRLQENAPDRYIVQPGDTLWSIARKFLKDPWRWPDIWRLNQDQIRNPHRIFPGDVIVLQRQEVPPQLTRLETLALSPQVREERLPADAIPAIPPNVIEPFLSEPLVIEEGGLAKAPRIVATQENRVHLGPGGLAYVSGLSGSPQQVWQIFRPGRALVDPDTQRTLGIEAIHLGTGRMVRPGDPATLQVTTSKQEITTGDRLVAAAPPALNVYVPHAPRTQIQGRIISILGGLAASEGGRYSIVSLNRGHRDGLEHGHVLQILRAGAKVPDPESKLSRDKAPTIQLPEEQYGLVFVFRLFDAVSYALVMESARPVAPGDMVRTP
jgi:hypothetical protein